MTEPDMTPVRAEAIKNLLLSEIRSSPERRVRRRRLRILWGSLGGIAIAGVVATGASLVMNDAAVSDQTLVHCLSEPTRLADGSYPGSAATIASADGKGRAEDALALCSEMWRAGVLEPSIDPTATAHASGTVPEQLRLCVLPDGSAAVVPSDQDGICHALGMAPLLTE